MLIIKAFINLREIDEIHIWNTGISLNDEDKTFAYNILKPEGFETETIYHKRNTGYLLLLKQALEIITKHGDNKD
jgi:hypothetical protein